ncbi:uncharacterized protein LOC125046721 [Penaeus chinensis]|uniref:uncharacterized protein LOC125046721 n=1 Tax=Penaeus chinensis TaxID=139456 RepID=UPI001FB6636F|nr:uncharacterized protein LOC125046721 [Penaeus chinensis]
MYLRVLCVLSRDTKMKFYQMTFILTCCALTTTDAASLKGRSPAGVPRDGFVIGAKSDFCRDTDTILTCDFQWEQENVYLPDHGIAKGHDLVILQRVHNLVLDRRACLNLSLREVAHGRAEGTVDESCSKVELSLRSVNLDAVEAPVTSLYAYKSHLERVAMRDVDPKLTVISSSVGEFDVAGVVDNGVIVQLHSTTVKHLKNLHVAGDSKVHLHNVTFEGVLKLVLASKGNLLTAMKFPPLKNEGDQPAVLLLEHGAEVTLEDIQGVLKIAVPACPAMQGTLTEDALSTTASEPKDQEQNVLLLLLVVSLALNFVLLLICICRCSTSKVESETKETKKNKKPLLSSPDELPSPKVKKKRKNYILSNLQSYICLTRTHLHPRKYRQKTNNSKRSATKLNGNSISHSAVFIKTINEREQRLNHRKARQRTLTYHGPYIERELMFCATSSEDGESYATNSSTDTSLSNEISHV